MRNFLFAAALLLAMGAWAAAQTYGQNQDPTSLPSTTSSVTNDSLSQRANELNAASQQLEQTDLNSPNFTHQDFRGTELEKAYQGEAESGWENPNITKSNGIDTGGGG